MTILFWMVIAKIRPNTPRKENHTCRFIYQLGTEKREVRTIPLERGFLKLKFLIHLIAPLVRRNGQIHIIGFYALYAEI